MNRDALIEQLVRHEGIRLFPYEDSVGKWTIGIGRNIEDIGITRDEALHLLKNDINRAEADARKYAWFNSLSDNRQNVIVNMIFNLGANRFAKFIGVISALAKGDYSLAADEMLDSKWAHQVGSRANELANQMRVG